MERLTYRGERDWEVKGADGTPCDEVCENRFLSGCHDCPIQTAFDRLAAYEDTGLEPEEIGGLCSMSNRAKMADLLRLEEYHALGSIDHLRELAQAEKDGRLVVLPCKVGDTIYVIYYGRIVETKVRTFFLGHPSHNIEKRNMRMIRTTNWDISMDEIGKRVFFTREEAEAALKKREEVDNEAD